LKKRTYGFNLFLEALSEKGSLAESKKIKLATSSKKE
jgi:hypothetical protein